ncbi:hypothetical protein CYMTET_26269 [Cymbomonas tetramitiformis]|uniref:Uncharacterized protein n=1 Tax=Cymbomonas tetramitiformis TaxID=36881 RepID=A0AAE0KY76_9CHLO|nr:hypothetical protein CYMTET_26269 [Cymbomonas tetramitiformis]
MNWPERITKSSTGLYSMNWPERITKSLTGLDSMNWPERKTRPNDEDDMKEKAHCAVVSNGESARSIPSDCLLHRADCVTRPTYPGLGLVLTESPWSISGVTCG